ncbi:PH domain-containing protein [Saccharomonospora glauca]|jgi:membrane protein YdbS with pleckstrin-like domain|uniref:YdbS-like PH domain-containing protein n=1 Tax=Saccharomonospora glauca K62 TaxID=928724 RepID=I1D1Z4_9PSEU|nr:PH domain-containing protein [Saccharomonospora glauca]EIE98968.1 hypothetical protein SacglDRAFT_02062 [Saccharomonospora glauca K62]
MPPTKPPRNRFHRATVQWWRTKVAGLFAAAVAVLVVCAVVPGVLKMGGPWLFGPTAVVAVLAVPAVILLPRWWFAVHRWEITDTAVHVRVGYFWQRWHVAPLSRIQTVDTVRGPLQRHFGLATLVVTTASAKGALKVEGLESSLAEELAEQLTRTTGATRPQPTS